MALRTMKTTRASRLMTALAAVVSIGLFVSACSQEGLTDSARSPTISPSGQDPSETHATTAPSSPSGTNAADDSPDGATSQVTRVKFDSEALGREKAMSVYLPPDYSPDRTYPVLYMIHGYGGTDSTWFAELQLDQHANRLIEAGEIEPLIIVSPDMETSYGINSPKTARTDTGAWEDHLIKDVISYVDENYPTVPGREGRYIGGLSMGGFIALHAALRHPDLFSKVGGHSPALFLDDWSLAGGEDGLKSFLYPSDEIRAERDPILLAESADLEGLQFYLDSGEDDRYAFYEGAQQLHAVIQSRGGQSQYHANPGGHELEYWREHGEDYLRFYAG